MISWHGGSGAYPKHSSQYLSTSSSHLYIHSATKKKRERGQARRIYSWSPFDSFSLLSGSPPAGSDFLVGWYLREKQCLTVGLNRLTVQHKCPIAQREF